MSNQIEKKVSVVRGVQVEVYCSLDNCSNIKKVRVADLKRGMGRFCSKNCSAKDRELLKKGIDSSSHVIKLVKEEDLEKLTDEMKKTVKVGV